ncbi:hypothetical protein DFH07DRAFT_836632 [Mycena maculata]|uniref:Uncharacterized protein n=1 Tax=Mycena maculata TaxID=230809 RepID=A0AAD7N282_9AGAR|nr:hypothetical protein DFH07DRAFT_836632 [Mycena maculata]
MCYATGSIDQAVGVCPMCKVFPSPHARCPHMRDVCRNRTAHPRFDVLYLKNAEVDSFNGCGYCKWARTNPAPKAAGWNNTGWPGCCRAPTSNEHRLIQPADWRSVSIVHHVQIPPEVKAALDNLSSRGSPVPSASPVRSAASVKPSTDRRNSSASASAKSATMPIPTKSRSGGSPQMVASSITSNSSRGSGGSGGASGSVPKASTMEESLKRRENLAESEKPPASSNSSPSRKHIDLGDATTPRRNSGGRAPASPTVTKVITDAFSSGTQERRRSVSSAQSTKDKASPPVSVKMSPPTRPVEPPKPQKKAEAEISSKSSSSGSDSLGSMTESTITSDGGFTDYLSDESEAELQRQAEAKAALVAQTEAEELEFRQARQALANIGLRPPKSWAGVETSTERTAARIAPSTRS